jgi:CDP-diacylglycerol--serine O-phosphatidyltransferase
MTGPDAGIPRRGFGRRQRRPGDPRRPRRGLYLLPHLITTAGIFFGFYAIVQAFTGNPDHAAVGIILAIVCDTLDGRVARLAKSASRFGLEYDSIADTVSLPATCTCSAAPAG